MTDLVVAKDKNILCDSPLVAKKFNISHRDVVRIIKNLIRNLEDLRVVSNHPKFIEKEGEYRGQRFVFYEMDRRAFSLLAMRFKTKRAFEWQVRFNEAFYEMEKMLYQAKLNKQSEEWLTYREQGKLIRREETDVIKQFVEYATKQGSQSAKFYYKHLTSVVYKCLGLIQFQKPKLRETLDLMQINQLVLAEIVARKSLLKYMKEGEHYKTIFTLVKQDLEKFAEAFIILREEDSTLKISDH